MVQFSPAGIILTDATKQNNPIIFVNTAFTIITGFSSEEVIGRNCRFLQGPATDRHSVAQIRETLKSGGRITLELLNYRKNGEEFWNELTISPEADANGEVVGFVGIVNDVSARRQSEAKSRELETRLTSIIENIPGYVFQRTLKPDGALDITYFSPYVANLLGIPGGRQRAADEIWAFILPDDREHLHRCIERSAADMSDLSVDFRLRTANGGERWMRTYSRPRHLESGAIVWDGIGLDITAERVAEERLSYLAYHDPLTGMPNRSLFDSSLAKALDTSQSDDRQMALLLIDLDGFQEVNDAVGRQIGDAVLRGLSKRIVDFAGRRAGYSARTGGDEFAVFFSPETQGHLPNDANALCRDLMQPLQVDDRAFTIEACIGVAAFPFGSTAEESAGEHSVSELMKRANIALHEAKRAGRGMHQLYSFAADDRRRNQTLVRQSLREAIDGRQFQLHYHPLVDLASGKIIGAEALIRWSHPTLGMQRPDIFIPLAEKTGLIIPIGAWVMEEAMRQAVDWARRHANVPKIAINVSGVQLLHPGFLDTIEGALARTGAKASQLEIELTEGFMIEASPVVLNVLNALKRMGFTLAVDDFGTGYASFRHLRDLPVDKLKIDQTFVRQMVVDSSDASIIRAIIALAKSLELEVVAEGIEDIIQRNFLRDEGCKIGQGYLFSLPLTAEDFVYLLDLGVTLPMGAPPEPSAVAERNADHK